MSGDDLTTALDQIRERSNRPLGPSVTALPISNEAVQGLLESAADVPRLLAALDEALKRHRPSAQRCILDDFSWPCPTVEAITRALTGKEAGGA